jgi:hypothetical protein
MGGFMAETKEMIKIIVATPVVTEEERPDRGGGQLNSLRSFFSGAVVQATEIDPEKLRVDIEKCLAHMKHIFADLQRPSIQGWKVEHINVGLSISAEGSVGVATAGVEASIEIGFAPEK